MLSLVPSCDIEKKYHVIDKLNLISFLILFFRIIQTKDRKEGINENDENSNAQALTDDRHNFNNKNFQQKKYFKKFNGAQYNV